jgi:hypothetical protein
LQRNAQVASRIAETNPWSVYHSAAQAFQELGIRVCTEYCVTLIPFFSGIWKTTGLPQFRKAFLADSAT